jgi:hypothetical protein
VRGAEYGHSTEAAPIWVEYLTRQSAKKLGYFDSFDDLDSFTADCFAIISSELSDLIEKKSKSKGGRR